MSIGSGASWVNNPIGALFNYGANVFGAGMYNTFVQPLNNFGNQVNASFGASNPAYIQQQALGDAMGNMEQQYENGKKMTAAISNFQMEMGGLEVKKDAASKASQMMRIA